MRGLRLSRLPAGLLVLAAGCVTARPEQAVAVRVVDAETKAPIAGAAVRLSHLATPRDHSPHETAGTTAADGVARLPGEPRDGGEVVAAATAAGYLPGVKDLPAAGKFGAAGGSDAAAEVVVEVYAAPRPTVELVVPNGFRGPVTVAVKVDPAAAGEPGRRAFTVAVPPSGEAELSGPAVLRFLAAPDFRARYADGTPLPRTPAEVDVGLRWLKTAGGTEWFVVGTLADYLDARKATDGDERGRGWDGPGVGGPRPSGRGGRGGRH